MDGNTSYVLGTVAATGGFSDIMQAAKIRRKSYNSIDELEKERVIGLFSYLARRHRVDMYYFNRHSLERPF